MGRSRRSQRTNDRDSDIHRKEYETFHEKSSSSLEGEFLGTFLFKLQEINYTFSGRLVFDLLCVYVERAVQPSHPKSWDGRPTKSSHNCWAHRIYDYTLGLRWQSFRLLRE